LKKKEKEKGMNKYNFFLKIVKGVEKRKEPNCMIIND